MKLIYYYYKSTSHINSNILKLKISTDRVTGRKHEILLFDLHNDRHLTLNNSIHVFTLVKNTKLKNYEMCFVVHKYKYKTRTTYLI